MINITFFGLLAISAVSLILSVKDKFKKHKELDAKAEMQKLQDYLKELIDSAERASANLNEQLMIRRNELEELLLKISAAEKSILEKEQELSSKKFVLKENPLDTVSSLSDSIELTVTNAIETKKKRSTKKKDFTLGALFGSNRTEVADPYLVSAADLESNLLNAPAAELDEITLAAAPQDKSSELVNEIVALESGSDNLEFVRYLDPITLKIARRLFGQGYSEQIISKKLDISVSQVRVLERYLATQNI
jgi:hypothetical protein